MLSFNLMHSLAQLESYSIPRQNLRLVHEIALSKGREQLFMKQNPETLQRLLDLAIVESVRASTAIEGVQVPEAEQLKKLISDTTWKPRNRDEEDVVAYKNALAFLYRKKNLSRPLSLALILELSKVLWAHDKKKAGLKKHDNKIVLRLPDGKQVTRFEPPSAKRSPALLEESCSLYLEKIKDPNLIDHQTIAAFILDFLCVHPLEDGNGRLARLLHTFLLVQNGYFAARYISLEGLVEQDKKNYYDSLYQSSKEWSSGKHRLNAWMNFSLEKLNLLYKKFERQVTEYSKASLSSLDRPERASVEKLILQITPGQTFSRTELENQLTDKQRASGRTIRRALEDLIKAGNIIKEGSGRGTKYIRL